MRKIEDNGLFIDGCFYDKSDLFDLLRLQRELLREENILFNLRECANIWQNYSTDLAAGWLLFPDSTIEILPTIRSSDFFTDFIDYSKLK